MKLYTEEALKDFLTNKQSFITLDDFHNLESIELPSDDEIENHIEDNFYKSERVHKYTEKEQLLMKATTISGAKWMRDKIQGGKK